ncbi:helix-turn-helix transcriptional regulator [Aquidulcibacter sp.]|uniref:helix-turn-helix transcriptional regulator n=1 Tax=Aquidulcibacter sp. TaxID=2052990 RepID=UPI0037BEC1EC
MAKRKPEPAHSAQLDMFGGWAQPANEQTSPSLPAVADPLTIEAANDQIESISLDGPVSELREPDVAEFAAPEAVVSRLQVPVAPVKPPQNWENDEWWTTAMVCAYLKLGRKAIWERTRNPKIGFPKPTHFGSCRHRWRAGEVRAWAEMR